MSQVGVMSLALRPGDVYTVEEKPIRVSEWENEREWKRKRKHDHEGLSFHTLSCPVLEQAISKFILKGM